MADSNKITLLNSDGETFEVDEAVACEFQIIAHMIEDGCAGNPIPLANVSSTALAKVIEYCKKHVEDGAVEENEEAALENLNKCDNEEFLKELDMDTHFTLILAANYLNIKGLLDLLFHKVADTIKDMQPEEVRKLFKIKNDYTPEEEEAIRKENDWAFQ